MILLLTSCVLFSGTDPKGKGGKPDGDGTSTTATATTSTSTLPCESTGFAADASTWKLPDTAFDATDYPWFRTYASTPYQSCNGKDSPWYYALSDLTGDGIPDLVVTRSGCDDPSIGQDHWVVYPGTGKGFGEPEEWALPDLGLDASDYPYGQMAADTPYQSCNGKDSSWYFTTTDLTGDGRPDLVVTRGDCDDTSSGKSRWDVYPGEADGFGKMQKWSLPETGHDASDYPWFRTYADTPYQSCGGKDSEWYFSTQDLTGDGIPDIVVTRATCDAASAGKTSWVVYRGDGNGFGAAETWKMPETSLDASDYPWFRTYADTPYQSCNGKDSEWYYVTTDISGDGAADLVVTRAACDDSNVGKKSWAVYLGQCQ